MRPSRHCTSQVLPLLLALFALFAPAMSRASSFVVDTVAHWGSEPPISQPILVMDPATSIPHLFWCDYAGYFRLYHAWRPLETWQSEIVASQVKDFSAARGANGGIALAWVHSSGVLVSGRVEAGAWIRDTLAIASGGWFGVSAAVDASGEPAVAYALERYGTSKFNLYLARHAGGVWSTTTIDSIGLAVGTPDVAFGPNGLPQLMWGRPIPPGLSMKLCHYEETTTPGVFVRTVVAVDATGAQPNLVLDPIHGRPRVVYLTSTGWKYAWRDAAAQWGSMSIMDEGSLVLTAEGKPLLAFTVYSPIEPQLWPTLAPTMAYGCDGAAASTCDVIVMRRESAEGTGSFDWERVPFMSEARSGAAMLDYTSAGMVAAGLSCWGRLLLLASETGVASIPPGPAGPLALAPPSPNPARAGAPLALAFTLPRAGEVAFALHDVSGRAVARREAATFAAGSHALRWTPPALAPGCYWLTMTTGEGRAHRSLVVMR